MSDRPEPPNSEQQQSEVPGHTAPMDPKPDHGEQTYKGFGRLAGKVAIITGGDSGIGRAVAIAFAREGADVLIAYLSEEKDARESMRWVEEAGRRAVLVAGDIADSAHCREIVRRAVAAFGRVDVLVNNAAFQITRESLDEISDEEWDRTFDVNIGAIFRITKAAVPHMKLGSSIINTASVNADTPKPKLLPYSATKAAIQNFSGSLTQLPDGLTRVANQSRYRSRASDRLGQLRRRGVVTEPLTTLQGTSKHSDGAHPSRSFVKSGTLALSCSKSTRCTSSRDQTWHEGDEFEEYVALAKQRTGASLHRVELEVPVIAERFACRTEQGQQHDRKSVDQPQAVAPIRGVDVHRTHPHPEPQVLGVAEGAFDAPALAVEINQRPGGLLGDAGGQAPGLLHVFGLHAHHGVDWIAGGGDRRAALHACASTRSAPLGRRPCLAVNGGHLDVAPEADDEVELQLVGQHPIELLVAEAAVGHDAHADLGGQHRGKAHQDLILINVAPVLQRGRVDRQPHQRCPLRWHSLGFADELSPASLVRGGTAAIA